eukprot:CAMPEP_0198662340 /NCGR_PEP_ID=MMETSP1467-20131203/46956_1 /TAXON_ID=1462469 /ORGANISM="unid. sp., Strain CCMP2135" /LENGTH=754 /DNA_ID=CAMNT_0044398821 /DNA_START=53 /DNA_END=2317 /DNA_ORIENTATION=-
MSLDFAPLQVLQDDLMSFDRSSRIRGVRGFVSIAAAIGSERARKDLVNIIQAHVLREEDDEVLYEIAGTLGADFISVLGGIDNAGLLVSPLRDLARIEETIVHERAVSSLRSLLRATPSRGFLVDLVLQTLVELSNCEEIRNGFGAKLSAAGLVAPVLDVLKQCGESVSTTKKTDTVCDIFRKLARDDATSVRRAAAEQIGDIAQSMSLPLPFAREFGLTIWELVNDDHDSVRVPALEQVGESVCGNDSRFDHALAWLAVTRRIIKRSMLTDVDACADGGRRCDGTFAEAGKLSSRLHTSQSALMDVQSSKHDVDVKDTDFVPASPLGSPSDSFLNDASLYIEHDAQSVEAGTNSLHPVFHMVSRACHDPSWRVRGALARSFHAYFTFYCRVEQPQDSTVRDLLSMYSTLFYDRELEVRVQALLAAPQVVAAQVHMFAMDAVILAALCQSTDAHEHVQVRLAAAKGLTQLLAILSSATSLRHEEQTGTEVKAISKEHHNAQCYIFEVVESRLLPTMASGAPEIELGRHVDVLLETIRGLRVAVPHLTPNAVDRVVLMIQSIAHDNWRVRRALNWALPAIAAKHSVQAFEAQLLENYIRSFQDRIYQVRSSAVQVLAYLRDLVCESELEKPSHSARRVFDCDWLMGKLGKRLAEVYLTMSYFVYRITIVQAFEKLALDTGLTEPHMETVILFLSEAARDEVPNVQLTAVQALKNAARVASHRIVQTLIKPVVHELIDVHSDVDVKLALGQALRQF